MTDTHTPQHHDDDRRRAVNNLFPMSHGQVNISHAYPGVTVAWHRHQTQTDYWYCVKGSFKVGLSDEYGSNVRWEYLNEHNRRVLVIPPGTWHGYRALGNEESVLLYWVTQQYNNETPDEERAPIGCFGECWETKSR